MPENYTHSFCLFFIDIKSIRKSLAFGEGFSFFAGIYKPNSVIDSYLSSPSITFGVKRFFPIFIGTRSCTGVNI